MPFQIMKAPSAAVTDIAQLEKYLPLIISPKHDGIRCVMVLGKAMTGRMKPIRNDYIRSWLEAYSDELEGFEGELTLPTIRPFREVTSAVMSRDGKPEFVFNVFDCWSDFRSNAITRIGNIVDRLSKLERNINARVVPVSRYICSTLAELQKAHNAFVDYGYEGSMVNAPMALYRPGRTTTKQAVIWKVKQRDRDIVTVIGYERKKTECTQRDDDDKLLGERSTIYHPEIGALVCAMADGTEFSVGSGLTADERIKLYSESATLVGRKCVVEHQIPRRQGDKPRFPTFQGWTE